MSVVDRRRAARVGTAQPPPPQPLVSTPVAPPKGPVSLDPHLGGSHVTQVDANTWMPDVWERLIVAYKIGSVLDVGCGGGFSTRWFLSRLGTAVGIEGDPHALAARQCDPIISHDFTLGPFKPVDLYDLGWCAEFVEHVDHLFMANWMASLQRCRYVCMTFATPGQGGWHHVNEQDEPYWLERFASFGFDHVPEETARLRATSKGEAWGRKTLTFFVNARLAR